MYVDDHHWILAGAREYPSGVPSSTRFTRFILSHLLLPVGEIFSETANANGGRVIMMTQQTITTWEIMSLRFNLLANAIGCITAQGPVRDGLHFRP